MDNNETSRQNAPRIKLAHKHSFEFSQEFLNKLDSKSNHYTKFDKEKIKTKLIKERQEIIKNAFPNTPPDMLDKLKMLGEIMYELGVMVVKLEEHPLFANNSSGLIGKLELKIEKE